MEKDLILVDSQRESFNKKAAEPVRAEGVYGYSIQNRVSLNREPNPPPFKGSSVML